MQDEQQPAPKDNCTRVGSGFADRSIAGAVRSRTGPKNCTISRPITRSCSQFCANQFCVLLTAAYVLMQELHLQSRYTDGARAQVWTLRE